MTCKYSLPVCILSFHSLNSVFHRAKIFNIDKVQLSLFALFPFMDCAFEVII